MTPNVDDMSERLPREPWTLVRSVGRHTRSILLFAVLAALCAHLVTRAFVSERYAAEAVLLFAPLPGDERGAPPARLESRRDMVKVLPNLQEVIRRRNLATTPAKLGSVVDARVKRDSNVLAIEVTWPDARLSADIANDLARLFLTQQAKLRRSAMQQLAADLERQQTQTRERLRKAADALGKFRQKSGALALDDQIRSAIAEVATLQAKLDEISVERENLRRQRARLPGVIDTVARQLSSGQFGKTAGRAPDAQTREVSRLRGAIEEERRTRERATALAGAQAEVARTRRLADMGLLPKHEADKAALELRKAQDAALDTPRIAAWRSRADGIETKLESGTNADAASASLAPEVGFRSFQIELDSASVEDKYRYIEDALNRAKAQLASYAPLQRQLFDLQTETARHERELAALEEPLSKARLAAASEGTEFQLVSLAQPDPNPVSRRRLLGFGGVFGALMTLFTGLVLFRELRTNKVRSGRELAYLSNLPVFAQVVQRGSPRRPAAVLGEMEHELALMGRLSRRLEHASKGGPVRVMITGSVSSAWRQRALEGLLAQYILQGRRVAWISLVEDEAGEGPTEGFAEPSIHEYLRSDALPPERLLTCRQAESVAVIGGAAPVAPHLRASERMRELVRRAGEGFDLVVVIGDSLAESPDELKLARECDVVVLLAEADVTTHDQIDRLTRVARDAELHRCGWVLLGVHPDFAALESEQNW